MKLNGLYLNNNIQTPESGSVRNNVSNAVSNPIMTVPTQIDSQNIEGNISSNASNQTDTKASETLKAQVLSQAPISYTFLRDIHLPFANNAKLFKLANGQKVAVLEKKGPTVLETYYNVGSMNEPDDKRGMSHFIEHMAFNGSNGPSGGLNSGDVFKIVNKMGALTNASTGFSQTNYYITSQLLGKGNVFDTTAYIQSEQLQYPEHAENMVTKEKGPVTQEISMVGDQPENAAFTNCIKNLFNIQTTSPDLVAGSISNINKLTRDDTLGYYNLWYTPDNCATVVTGEVPPQEAINTIAKYFNKSVSVPVQNRKYQDFNVTQKPVRVDIKMPKAHSSIMALGFAGPQNNSTKENIIMEVLMTSLLGYKNARISKELNKIQSSAMMNIERVGNRPTDPKVILIASQSTPQKTEQVIKIIYQEIGTLAQKPITEEELQTAKKILTMTFSKISENSQMLNMLLGNALLDDDISYVENYLNILNNIKPEDISAFAKKYLDLHKASLAVVHPAGEDDASILENYNKANNVQNNASNKSVQNIKNANKLSFKARLEDKMMNMQKIKQLRLANNMEVILNPNKSDIATSQIVLQTTAPADVKPAVPSILSVMLNEGSKDKNYEQFYKNVHKSGMNLKFDADFRSISASVESLAQDAGYSVDLIKEVFNHPRFNESSLTYAKKLVKEAVLNVDDSASEIALAMMFPHLNEFATKEEVLKSIDEITLQDIQGFYNYIKSNSMAKAVYTAPFEKKPELEKTIISKLSMDLGLYKPFNTDTFKSFIPVKENKILTKAQQRNQADIISYYKFKTNYNPKDHAVFVLLNTILGGGPSSRLFEDLREKEKLAYRVESNIDFVGDTGVMSLGIKTTTDNPAENIKQYDNVEKSLNGFQKHIDMLKTEMVTAEELEAAKLRVKTKILNSLESSASQTSVLNSAKDNICGISTINENLKLIDAVTVQDIQNAANYIFDSKSVTSILASQDTLDNMNLNLSPEKEIVTTKSVYNSVA